jgi:hypothetical protein
MICSRCKKPSDTNGICTVCRSENNDYKVLVRKYRLRQDAEIWLLDEGNLDGELLLEWFQDHPRAFRSCLRFMLKHAKKYP